MIQYRPKCMILDCCGILPGCMSALRRDLQNKLDCRGEPMNGYVEIKDISALSDVVGL